MISCKFFHDCVARHGVDFFTGVPDSLLKDFCAYLADHTSSENHITAANEGGAVALACGHYLATSNPSLVYMQNSGQGNAVNPLVSLADQEVYSIPMLLVIGWRGEPGKKDEPQHIKQGKITLSLLDTLGVPFRILPDTNDKVQQCFEDIFDTMQKTAAPVALVVQKGTFEPYQSQHNEDRLFEVSREDAVKLVIDNIHSSDIIISTTGKMSREIYEYRDQMGADHNKDFLSIGSMGHASQIALGVSLAKSQKQVFCMDGDGAAIMHMGGLAIIGSQKAKNFKHIIFNNGAHDSVGGQPTAGTTVSFPDIAQGCGYKLTLQAKNHDEIVEKIVQLRLAQGPALLEIKIKKGARSDLGRPKTSPKQNRDDFMEFLSK